VTSCCDPNGLSGVFDAGRAASDARRYRRKGLTRETRTIADLLIARGIGGATILEIGGGIGDLQVELLRAGAARATSVEISAAYESTARELATELGVDDRIEHHLADFAREPARIDPADAVILNKVVCCYLDMPGLVRLVLAFPADRWWIRIGVRVASVLQATFRRPFRVFFHEPAAIVAIAREAGLREAASRRGIFWQVQMLERA